MANLIITIGRECGSGGHTIAKRVSEKLGLPFYDKKIVDMASAKTKLSPEFIESNGEYFHGGSLGHVFGYGARFGFDGTGGTGSSLSDQLYQAQSEIVLEIAEKESCVIVGRCADYILENKHPTLNVFIFSDMPFKIERSIREHNMNPEKAESILKRRDKARAEHYRFYTDKKWGERDNYDLCLDSGRLGEDLCVELIAAAYERLK